MILMKDNHGFFTGNLAPCLDGQMQALAMKCSRR